MDTVTEHSEIERLRLRVQQLEHRNSQLSTLLDVSRAASSTTKLDETLASIAEQIATATRSDGCTLSWWDRDSDTVRTWIEYRSSLPEWADPPGTTYPLELYPATRKVLETRRACAIRMSDPGADPEEIATMRAMEVESLVMLPLANGEQVFGLVELCLDFVERQYSDDDIALAQALSDFAGVAIENARLHDQTQQRLREQTALRVAAKSIGAALDEQVVLGRIAEQTCLAIDATSAYICDLSPAMRSSTVIAEHITPQANELERVSDLGTCYEEIEEEFIAKMKAGKIDYSHPDEATVGDMDHLQEYGGRSVLYVPLKVRDELIGFVEVWESREKRVFTADELDLCAAISRQAAVALDHARLHQRLQDELAVRKEAEIKVRSSLEEKEVLIKEIHHRVKNNLQVVLSLLNLQTRQSDSEQITAALRDSQNRIRTMALLHEKLYKSSNLSRIDLADYLKTMAQHLPESYGADTRGIELTVNAQSFYADTDTVMACGLITNELVANALEHAFPNGGPGAVTIDLMRNDGLLTLRVSDTGVGPPADFDFDSSDTLGLQLVQLLTQQINGTLSLQTGDGTRVSMSFCPEETNDDGE